MGKKHKKHTRENKEDVDDFVQEKPTGLKLVLKVGAPLTPSDITADSQSETFDSDTATSETKLRLRRRVMQNDRAEPEEKKLRMQNDEDEDDSEDRDEDFVYDKDQIAIPDGIETEDDARVRNLRDKRSTDDDKSALHYCLDYFQKILQRKDGNGFFAFPVTDNFAPGYSSVISHPMDFSTMRAKIDAGEYQSIAEYRADYQQMMENCMKYNHPETVYYREAKRLLSIGLKHMSREYILQMKRNLPAVSSLTTEEIGIDDETPEGVSYSTIKSKSSSDRSSQRKESLGRFEAIPDNMTPEEILRQAQNAASGAANRLALRAPNSKFGFLKRRENGSTTLNILNPDNSGYVSDKERVVSLGELIGKVTSGTGTLIGLKEDRRNKVNPVNYLSYGAFSSYGPVYDSSAANLSKEDSDLLMSTYGDETGLQYAKSLQTFVSDAGQYSVRMVDNLLDILTSGEHTKTHATLIEREQQRLQEEQEEAKKRLEMESSNSDESLRDPAIEMNPMEVESQRRLDGLSALLAELHRLQNARLGSQLPEHLSDVSKPSDEETALAQKISRDLTQMVKMVLPADVVTVQTVRNAIGITNEPVQDISCRPTDNSVQPRVNNKQNQIDNELNDFFGQGTSSNADTKQPGVVAKTT